MLAERGVFVPAVISITSIFQGLWTPFARGRRLVGGVSMNKNEPLQFVTELLQDDALEIVIDRRFSLERIQEAHRLVDTGHKKGNVIIDVVSPANE